MMNKIFNTIFILFLSGLFIAQQPEPVKVEEGLLQGTLEDGLAVYRGIPFAAPPVGELRWHGPQPADRWYIAGINAENTERTITLNVPFISNKSRGIIITDFDNKKEFVKNDVDFSKPVKVTMYSNGGFVIKTLSK